MDREGGSLGYDFLGASFPGWPSIRSRRLMDGFLLKPISACEEVPCRSTSVKLGSPKSLEGSSDGLNWSNTPNSSSDWPNSMTCSLPSAPTSSVSAACWDEEEPANVAPPLSRRSLSKQETVLRYGNSVKPRILGLDHVLQSRERFLNRIVPKDLVSSSDLEVAFVHKNLRLKNGL